jgi:ribosome-binding factor A
MVSRRRERLSSQIVREVSDILRSQMRDPRLGFASVTDADLSKDLRHVQVYVSVMGTPDEQRETMELLRHAVGFVRTQLAERLQIRSVPELEFRQDHGIERGARVTELLREIEAERAVNPPRLDETAEAAPASTRPSAPAEEQQPQ